MKKKRGPGPTFDFAAEVAKLRSQIDAARREGRALSRLRLRAADTTADGKSSSFHDLAFRMQNGSEAESRGFDGKWQPVAIVYGVTAAELAELGGRLLEIFEFSRTAQDVFELPKRRRGKPVDKRKDFMLFEYWSRMVDEPESSSAIAKEVADNYGKDPATVKRLARQHREHFLRLFGETMDLSKLRAHLKKKSKGGNVAK